MLRQRVLTALVLVALVGLAVTLSGVVFQLFCLAVMGAAMWEWSKLNHQAPGLPSILLGAFGALVLLGHHLGWWAFGAFDLWAGYAFAVVTGFWSIFAPLGLRRKAPVPFQTLLGAILLAVTWLAVLELQRKGFALLLFALCVVWMADTAAYFAGRRFGKHKLAPSISPGKTWEGVAGGVVGVLLLGALAGHYGWVQWTQAGGWVAAALLGLTALGVIGDLYESMLKRHAGVKDSGTLLPGHGGVLDRVDALIAVLPAAALFFRVGAV